MKLVQVDDKERVMTIIAVYGPNFNDKVEEKDKFWEEVISTTDDAKGILFITEDFNGRISKKDDRYKIVIGEHREESRNDNGKRMLHFCLNHNVAITNTSKHKYTLVQHNKEDKSIIDYVLVERENRSSILDVKIRRGAGIHSDNDLVEAKIEEHLEGILTKKNLAVRFGDLAGQFIEPVLLNQRSWKSRSSSSRATTE
ncbi:hypothetical protein Trydic_g17880 [Trypoxylus dichotomus]